MWWSKLFDQTNGCMNIKKNIKEGIPTPCDEENVYFGQEEVTNFHSISTIRMSVLFSIGISSGFKFTGSEVKNSEMSFALNSCPNCCLEQDDFEELSA